MRTRPLHIALGAAAVAVLGLTVPATAQAADSTGAPKPLDKIAKSMAQASAGGDDCSITGLTPHKVVLGITPKAVRFNVTTDCDDADHQIKWAVTGDLYPTSHVSWFGACTYTYTGPASLSCPGGSDTLDVIGTGQFQGNSMAGKQNAYVYAFDDANADNRDDDTSYECDADGNCTKKSSGRDNATLSFEMLRRTGWGTSFSASTSSVARGGQVTFSGRLTSANWDNGSNEGLSATAKLQFKATGDNSFHSVRTVTSTGGSVSTTVSPKRSGTFRLLFRGDAEHARSASHSAQITVTN